MSYLEFRAKLAVIYLNLEYTFEYRWKNWWHSLSNSLYFMMKKIRTCIEKGPLVEYLLLFLYIMSLIWGVRSGHQC